MSYMKEHLHRLLDDAAERREHAKIHGRSAAHCDGYDYADYMVDDAEWANMVLSVANKQGECFLQLAAARDYKEHADGNAAPMPRGKYIEDHVAGQIDRALEIAGFRE